MRLTNKDYKDRVGEAFDDLVYLANINPNDVCKFPVKNLREQELKLGQLEDIEEEFGISLVIVITALMKGVEHIVDVPLDYEQHDSGFWEASKIKKSIIHSKVQLEKYKGEWTFKWGGWDKRLLLKDCGKTWALTEEELK